VSCKVKVNRHGFLALRVFWNGMRSWEGTGLADTPENRKLLEASALVISTEIRNGSFEYVRWFPDGNKVHLFRRDPETSPSQVTAEAFYKEWIEKQKDKGRAHRSKDYKAIEHHALKTRIGQTLFGKIRLGFLTIAELEILQSKIKARGLKASSVNGVVHSCLRVMIRDARKEGLVTIDLYDKTLFPKLPETDTDNSIDPYTPEERETILGTFKAKRPHYHAFVFFRFWTGCRPSEAIALRWGAVDLRYATARIQRSRVGGKEAGTKTKRSNREIHLHDDLLDVLKTHKPLHVKPQDYVFTTPAGSPIDQENFYKREWLPILRAKEIRPRPFYNTRHSYVSFMLSIGARPAFISAQTGDSIRTLEAHYGKYQPDADTMRELIEEKIQESATHVKPATQVRQSSLPSQKKKGLKNQPLKSGAGEEGRTPDLMLGKHTL
jgi:integrase